MYSVCQQHCPVYIGNMVQFVANSTHRQGLWSSTYPMFVVPRTRTKLGERAFAVCGPVAWNALPATIRNMCKLKIDSDWKHCNRQTYDPKFVISLEGEEILCANWPRRS